MNKYIIYGFVLFLIVGGVWQYTRIVAENGKLTQANATLEQTAKDWENDYKKIKLVAETNAAVVARTAKVKNNLIIKAARLARDLEILKNENADIKKWSINLMPSILAYSLLDVSGNESENGLYKPADGVTQPDGRAEIEVQNENLYTYADELKTALRSCNADKMGLREWYKDVSIILQ